MPRSGARRVPRPGDGEACPGEDPWPDATRGAPRLPRRAPALSRPLIDLRCQVADEQLALPAIPRRAFRAFLRGRHCSNLLDRPCDDALLARKVGEVRSELGLDRAVPGARASDRLAFVGWCALAVAIVWGPLVPMAALAWWLWR